MPSRVKTGSVSANRPSVASKHLAVGDPRQPQPASGMAGHADRMLSRLRPRQPGRIRRPGKSGHDPVVRRGDLPHLAGPDIDDPQPPVLRRDCDRRAVRRRRQPGDAANLAGRDPPRSGSRIGWTCRVAGADLQGVAAISVGRPDHLSAGPQYLRETRPGARNNRHSPSRPIPVGQPVHGSANLDRAGPPATVDGQRADVVLGRDKAGGPAAHGRAEGDVEPDRPGCLQVIEQPQLAAARVDDPLPVGAGLACIPALVIGVPPQVAAVQRAGVDVAGALVVTDEREPPADDHRAGELGRQVREHAPERSRGSASRTRCIGNDRRGRANPQAPGGAAAVALPVGRIVVEASPVAGEQPDRASPAAIGGGAVASRAVPACAQRQVGYRAERQHPFCARAARQRGRQRAGPDVVCERLVRPADGQYLPGRGPAADPSPRRAPVGEPGAGPVGETGHVDLRAAVLGADPGHVRAVRGQPRRRRLCLVRGEPPGPAAGDRCQPDVVSSDETHEVVGDMRVSQVSRRLHRAIVRFHATRSPEPVPAKTAARTREHRCWTGSHHSGPNQPRPEARTG